LYIAFKIQMKKLLIILVMIAATLYSVGQPVKDIDKLEKQMQNSNIAQFDTYNQLSFLSRHIQPAKSIFYARKALEIATEKNDRKKIAIALDHLGLGYRYSAKYDSALIFHQQALDIATEIKNDSLLATINNRIALVYKKKGDFLTAIEYLKKSLEVREKLGDKDKVADVLNNIGNLFLNWGDYDKALEYFDKTLRIRYQTGSAEGLCYIYNNLGNLYSKQGNYTEAIEYHQKSLHIKDSLDDDYGRASSYHNIGKVYDRMGEYRKSFENYKNALALFIKVGDRSGCANLLLDMGLNRQNTGNLDEAEKDFQKALKDLKALDEKQGIANAWLYLSRIYFTKGEYRSISSYLDSLTTLNDDLHSKLLLKDIYYLRAQVAMKRGSYKTAFDWLNQYSEINDSLVKEEKEKISQNSALLKAYNGKELENELLKKELEVRIVSARNQSTIRKILILFCIVVTLLLILLYYKYLRRKRLTQLLEEKAAELNEQKNLSQYTFDKLKTSEQKLQAIFENSNVGICTIDKEGNIELKNNHINEIFGDKEDGNGNLLDFFNKTDAKNIRTAIDKIVRKEEPHYFNEFRLKSIDNGKHQRIELNISSILNQDEEVEQLICNISDITESFYAKHELHKQLNFLQTLIETIPSPVFYKSIQGKFIGCNTELLNLIGKKRNEVINKTAFDITSHDLAVAYELKDQELLKSRGKQIYEGKVKNKYGKLKDVIFYKSCIIEKDEIVGIVGIIVDITERKKLEEQNKEAREKAESATGMKSMFLANMSHEIRTPMNGIFGMIDFMKGTKLTHEQKEYLDIISISSQNLLDIIDEILDFSKIESGQLEIENIDFDLKTTVEEVVKLMSLKAKQKKLKLTTEIPSDLPEMVMGDPLRLKQVILNLVNNAIKFTQEGFVKVSCETLKASKEESNIRFTVEDSGIGMNEEQLSRIFKPFSQSEKSTARKFGGSGLGLIICKNLVGLMGGEITVESAEGKGSKFSFTLPFKNSVNLKSKKSEKEIEKEKDEIVIVKSDKTLNILVAEDDFMNQRFLTILLNKMGHKYEIAEDGLKTLEKFNQGGFDVILMDLDMPEMDGLTATRKIRMIEKEKGITKGIKIIAVTAKVIQGDREKCLKAGMDSYISKPFKSKDLHNMLEELGLFSN